MPKFNFTGLASTKEPGENYSHDSIEKLREENTKLKHEIAEKDEIISDLRNQLNKRNFNISGRLPYDLNVDEILSLKKQGWSNCAIARKLGCSEGTIRNRIKNN